MPTNQVFHAHTALAEGLKELFKQLTERLSLRTPINNDKEDIAALVRCGPANADEIAHRATSALVGYVGGLSKLRLNLRDAVALARQVEAEKWACIDVRGSGYVVAKGCIYHA